MKKLILLMILLTLFLPGKSQENRKTRKQMRAEKELKKANEIKELINNKNYVFVPRTVQPLQGSSIQVTYTFSATIEEDTINSYLPFYGVAYNVDYATRVSPFDFTLPIENYEAEKVKNGYEITFDVRNRNDYLQFRFNISKSGFASLNINSTNRQAISYQGIIEKPEERD